MNFWAPFFGVLLLCMNAAVGAEKVAMIEINGPIGPATASYIARATTSGSFVKPPAHAEEMYNPALQGRSDGGRFRVEPTP